MLIIGLMSGTSLDGIDACLVDVCGVGDRLTHRQRHFLTVPLAAELRERLLAQLDPATSRVDGLAALHVELGEAFAAAALACCEAAGVPIEEVDAIGSHGQTIWHAPAGRFPATLQLGEPAVIAVRTGVTTVADFRPADVAAGGQGAPLVPYVDHVLFGRLGYPVALQNLGGIGNVTYLPGDGDPDGLLAFDTGPGNMVIDAFAHRLSEGRCRFDEDGLMAAAGTVHEGLLKRLMASDPYLALEPPKSTGREAYGAARVAQIAAEAGTLGVEGPDLMATVTAWTAACVADQYRRFLPAGRFPREMLVSGGGASNPVLMRELAARLPELAILPLSARGVDPDAKEALAFAILAHQALKGQPNVLPRSTGSRQPLVLGQIVPGRNFARAVLKAPAPRAGAPATEQANPLSRGLDEMPIEAAVAVMHANDYDAVRAVEPAMPAIAALVADTAAAFQQGGRLFYVGAGTSGRLGVLDASECPPTFSSPPELVQGLIAGGEPALRQAVEGAEDDRAAGSRDLLARGLTAKDVVVGLSANGGAPYVQGALAEAREKGATTALVTCNPLRSGLVVPDHLIVLPVGPEVLAGSTRLKAGTATKLVLNMISTLSMVRIGKVHDNLMVDVQVSNAKLKVRARRLVERLTGLSPEDAEGLLDRAGGRVKVAAVMHHAGVDAGRAQALLAESRGFLRPWLTHG